MSLQNPGYIPHGRCSLFFLQVSGKAYISLSKKSSASWAFSVARGKIAAGGEKDAGTWEDGSQCDRDGGNRWPGTRGAFATVYKGNIIKNLIMDCQSYTKYRPNETTGGIFVSWRRKEELPTGLD